MSAANSDLNVKRSALNVERSASAADADNPWLGLATFTEEQSGLFYGRDEEIRDLTRRAERNALTVLFGQSGLGKSSLLQAGVFPRLRAASYWPIYVRLDHGPGAPTPAEQVKSLIHADTVRAGTWTKPGSAKPGESLWEFFHHRDDRLVSAAGRTIVPVLVFDQFEELFTLGAGSGSERARAVAFMSELAELVENRPPEQLVARLEESSAEMDAFDFSRTEYRVVISLREDYLPHLESLRTAMPALMENRMRLSRMTGTQALDAVVKPGGALVTEEVARAIVEFVAGARGGSIERLAELDVEPPLLSVICRELNERRRALGQEKITADLVSGNRREILNDFYERSVGDLPEGMRVFVEDHLLTKSGFRDNLALETALEFPGVTRPLVDTLVSRRLLRIEDRLGVQRVELTHDVLAEVVRAARDARQQRTTVAAAARQERRQRWIIAGLAAAVVALLVGAFFGIRAQRRSAAQASQTDLVLGSRLLDEGKLAEGLAYLVRAGRKDPANSLIAPRLLSALSARTFLLPTAAPLSLPSPAVDCAYSANGRWIIVQGEDGVVRIIDAATWQVAHDCDFGQNVRSRAVAMAEKNGDVFAVVLADETILVCDTTTGRPGTPPIRPPAKISKSGRWLSFGLSPDGRWLAAGGPGEVWLWDAATGELAATLPVNDAYREFSFSPDSRKLAITRDHKTTMWSIPDRAFVGAPIESSASEYYSTEFSSDGRRLLVRNGGEIIVADASTGVPVRPMIPFANSFGSDFHLSRDGSKLIQVTASRTVVVLDVATGRPAYPPLIHGGNVRGAWQVDEGRVLFTNSIDGSVRFWDLATGKLLAGPTLRQPRYAPAVASPDGKSVALFTAAGPAFRLRVGGGPAAPLALPRERATTLFLNLVPDLPARLHWVTPTGARAIDIASGRETTGGVAFPEPVSDARRSTYGSTLGPGDVVIVRTRAGVARIWTLGENGVVRDVPLADPPADSVTIATIPIDSAAQRLASPLDIGGAPNARILGVWDAQTGRRVATIDAGSAIATSNYTAFSPDGKRVVFRTRDDNVIHVCDLSTGKDVFTLQLTGKAFIRTWRYNRDGKRILTGDTWGGIQVWDAATGAMVRSTQYHRTGVAKFEYSPDPRFYASVSSEGSVQVWDAATDLPVGDLLEQSGAASRAEFSPDSTRIATPSGSGNARVWDVQTGLPVTDTLNTEGDPTNVVAISVDGRFLEVHGGAASVKQHVRVWPVPPSGGVRTPDWLLTLATICAGHRLTDEGKLVGALDELAKIDDVQRALATAPATDPYAEWGRWILSDSPDRSIAPGFTITPAEAAKLKTEWLKK